MEKHTRRTTLAFHWTAGQILSIDKVLLSPLCCKHAACRVIMVLISEILKWASVRFSAAEILSAWLTNSPFKCKYAYTHTCVCVCVQSSPWTSPFNTVHVLQFTAKTCGSWTVKRAEFTLFHAIKNDESKCYHHIIIVVVVRQHLPCFRYSVFTLAQFSFVVLSMDTDFNITWSLL